MEIRETTIDFWPIEVDATGTRERIGRRVAELLTFTIQDSEPLEFVRVPQGSFLMGAPEPETGSRSNERPLHQVALDTFFLGRIPITQRQWKAVTGRECRGSEFAIGDDLPVVNVWLEEALIFCGSLSKLTGKTIRLPSEAEWEYACRAGTRTAFCYGDLITPEIVNYADSHSGGGPSVPGSFDAPNQFGLIDMHGNVWEWCSDLWHEDYEGAPVDGRPWVTGGDASYCVQRGGSWRSEMSSCRSASRVGDIAHNDEDIVGIRVCFTP
jgi:formylglycine-generating enzyme required for sulfatase activity